jgi:hypothetical protein
MRETESARSGRGRFGTLRSLLRSLLPHTHLGETAIFIELGRMNLNDNKELTIPLLIGVPSLRATEEPRSLRSIGVGLRV